MTSERDQLTVLADELMSKGDERGEMLLRALGVVSFTEAWRMAKLMQDYEKDAWTWLPAQLWVERHTFDRWQEIVGAWPSKINIDARVVDPETLIKLTRNPPP